MTVDIPQIILDMYTFGCNSDFQSLNKKKKIFLHAITVRVCCLKPNAPMFYE